MGSLESVIPLKREHSHQLLLRSSWDQRLKSRITRIVLFNKIDYLQWICTVGVFFFFVVVFQMLLPGTVVENSENTSVSGDLELLNELGGLDFGEDVMFQPFELISKLKKENGELNGTSESRRVLNFAYRKPKLGLVFANLLVDRYQVMMFHVVSALRKIGYEVEVLALEHGPTYAVWRDAGIPVNIIETNKSSMICIDWLKYASCFQFLTFEFNIK